MDRQVLPLRWMLAGAKRYARKRRVYTRDHDTTMTDRTGRFTGGPRLES